MIETSLERDRAVLQRQIGMVTGVIAAVVTVANSVDRVAYDGYTVSQLLTSWVILALVLTAAVQLWTIVGRPSIARPVQAGVFLVTGLLSLVQVDVGNLNSALFAGIGYILLLEFGYLARNALLKTTVYLTIYALSSLAVMVWVNRDAAPTIVAIVLGNVCVILIGVSLVRFRFRRHRRREQELEQVVQARTQSLQRRMEESERLRGDLQESLEEKNLLLNELHHRTKNNLQLVSSVLNMETRRLSDPAAVAVLTDGMHRVRALALAHEHLYGSDDLKHVDLETYTRSLLADIWESVAGPNMQLGVNFRESMPVDLDFAISFGLVLNELVANSAKHAGAGREETRVLVEVRREAGELQVTIRDNGPGMPQPVDLVNPKSTGLKLVVGLVGQLDGSVTVSNDEGTRWELHFHMGDRANG